MVEILKTSAGTATTRQAAPSGSGPGASAFASTDFETFLKMLTTQIKNQDPLNSMEGTEFAVQLATFSGLSSRS